MKKKNTLLAAAGVLALAAAHAPADVRAQELEKCYGVSKAGMNDCGNAQGTHSCAGQAQADGDGGEWLFVPKGLCERLVNGSTEPKV